MAPEKTILITGATGFIGSHLAERLLPQNVGVRLLVRDQRRLQVPLRASTQIIKGDLEKPETLLPAVQGVDVVFHCAANVKTWDRRANYQRVNVQGLENLLEAIAKSGSRPARFVHLSSVDVYAFPQDPCAENCPCQASGFGYGDSKLQGEELLRSRAGELGLSYTILRPCNVMGPRSPFIERIGHELRKGLMMTIGKGKVDAGFLSVSNLVDVMLWAADTPEAHQETFNVKDPEAVTWQQFLQDFRKGIAGKGRIIDLPYRLAAVAAQGLAAPYKMLGIQQEPLLHPLLIKIFGRTCGHSVAKLQAAGAPVGKISYAETMKQSIDWYRRKFCS